MAFRIRQGDMVAVVSGTAPLPPEQAERFEARYGIPVLAVTAVGKDLGKGAKYLSMASRIAAETGAHIVKTYYCEGFETRSARSVPVSVWSLRSRLTRISCSASTP